MTSVRAAHPTGTSAPLRSPARSARTLSSAGSQAGPAKTSNRVAHRLFDAFLKLDLGRADHLVFTEENQIGVAVWKAPNRWKMPTGDMSTTTSKRSAPARTCRASSRRGSMDEVEPGSRAPGLLRRNASAQGRCTCSLGSAERLGEPHGPPTEAAIGRREHRVNSAHGTLLRDGDHSCRVWMSRRARRHRDAVREASGLLLP
jgi:hypothetical protein